MDFAFSLCRRILPSAHLADLMGIDRPIIMLTCTVAFPFSSSTHIAWALLRTLLLEDARPGRSQQPERFGSDARGARPWDRERARDRCSCCDYDRDRDRSRYARGTPGPL